MIPLGLIVLAIWLFFKLDKWSAARNRARDARKGATKRCGM